MVLQVPNGKKHATAAQLLLSAGLVIYGTAGSSSMLCKLISEVYFGVFDL